MAQFEKTNAIGTIYVISLRKEENKNTVPFKMPSRNTGPHFRICNQATIF